MICRFVKWNEMAQKIEEKYGEVESLSYLSEIYKDKTSSFYCNSLKQKELSLIEEKCIFIMENFKNLNIEIAFIICHLIGRIEHFFIKFYDLHGKEDKLIVLQLIERYKVQIPPFVIGELIDFFVEDNRFDDLEEFLLFQIQKTEDSLVAIDLNKMISIAKEFSLFKLFIYIYSVYFNDFQSITVELATALLTGDEKGYILFAFLSSVFSGFLFRNF